MLANKLCAEFDARQNTRIMLAYDFQILHILLALLSISPTWRRGSAFRLKTSLRLMRKTKKRHRTWH